MLLLIKFYSKPKFYLKKNYSFTCNVVISLSDHLQMIFEWFDHKTFRILCCPFVMWSPERNGNTRSSNKFSFHYFISLPVGRWGLGELGVRIWWREFWPDIDVRRCCPQSESCLIYITPSLRPHLLIQPVQWTGHLLRMKYTR